MAEKVHLSNQTIKLAIVLDFTSDLVNWIQIGRTMRRGRKHKTSQWMLQLKGESVEFAILSNLRCGRRVLSLSKNDYHSPQRRAHRLGTYRAVKNALDILVDIKAIVYTTGKQGVTSTVVSNGMRFGAVCKKWNIGSGPLMVTADDRRLKSAKKSMGSKEGRSAAAYIWSVTYTAKPGAPAFIMHDRIAAVRSVSETKKQKKKGRMYDGGLSLQGLRREHRQWIRMCHDGKVYDDLIEADFCALHYNLLYALNAKAPCPGDAYTMVLDHLGLGAEYRNEIKVPLVIVANSRNRVACRIALASNFANSSKPLPFGTPQSFMAAVEFVHSAIAGRLYKPNWFELHNHDCNLLIKIINRLQAERIPLAPLHDAVIVPREFEEKTLSIMALETTKLYGFALPTKSKPIGSVTVVAEPPDDSGKR